MGAQINEEDVNDRAKLMLHRIIARRLAQDPHLIDAAKTKLHHTEHSADYEREWMEILMLERPQVRRILTSRSERMIRLRLSSPFIHILGFKDPSFRKRVWRLARKGLQIRNSENHGAHRVGSA